MKQRYFIDLVYKGCSFHGWQIQPNAATVQEELNKALSTILRENISVVGAGRTDTGVHASYFIAHFDSENFSFPNKDKIIYNLNSLLHNDISINNIFKVDNEAHARFDALSRTYEYHISLLKNPFTEQFSYYFPYKPDINIMNEAANILFEYSDFTSFSKLHTDTKTNICKIYTANWKELENKLIFTIKADRFLRNMVRAIVGTLLDVGIKKITISQFRKIIESKNRSNAGYSVPAKGLFLSHIEYPEEMMIYD